MELDNQSYKIQSQVNSAINNALFWSEVDQLKRKEKELIFLFLDRKMSLVNFLTKLNEFDDSLGTLVFNTINDLTIALKEFGATESQIDSCLKEQLLTYQKVVSSGFLARYSITPYRTEIGGLTLIPGIQFRLDKKVNSQVTIDTLNSLIKTA